MFRQKPPAACVIPLVLALAACPARDGELPAGADAGSTTPVAPGPFRDVVDGICDYLDRCSEPSGEFLQSLSYRNREECRRIVDFSLTCDLREDEFVGVERVTLSRLPVEPSREEADACVALFAEAPCDLDVLSEAESDDSACLFLAAARGAEVPTLAGVNEPCRSDASCLPELYCAGSVVDEARALTSCQVCRPRLGEGELCGETPVGTPGGCADGLRCRADSDGELRCEARFEDGERCFGDDDCASGFCSFDEGDAGSCSSAGRPGDPCVQSCRQDEAYCESEMCRPLKAAGEACASLEECADEICFEGRCVAAEGSDCVSDDDCANRTCREETCRQPLPPGGCYVESDCPEPMVCLGGGGRFGGRCDAPQSDDAPCAADEECASGMCSPDGVCFSEKADGAPCRGDAGCVSGFCSPFTDTCQTPKPEGASCMLGECGRERLCVMGTCRPPKAPGEACDRTRDFCENPFQCLDGRCELPNLTCAPAATGQRCAALRVCDEASYCDPVDEFRCQPRALLGEPCVVSAFPGTQTCAGEAYCSPEAVCLARVAEGEACTDGRDMCAAGAFCVAGVCRGGDVGLPCDRERPCPAGLFCGGERRCLPRLPEGEACRDDDACVSGFICDEGRCTAPGGEGDRCVRREECRPELHCDLTGPLVCVVDSSLGGPCRGSDECAPGTYCQALSCAEQRDVGEVCGRDEECVSGACDSNCLASAECFLPES